MKIWLVTIGEPVPVKSINRDRLHRTGAFANYLSEKGHEVVWWTSTFDHFARKHLFQEHTTLNPKKGLTIRLIHGCGYRKNISFSRILDHKQVSRSFSELIRLERNSPDVILAAFPTVELASECVRYGKNYGIPVLIDIRDLWPDIFADVVPGVLKGFIKLALTPMNASAVKALQNSTGIIGISDGYLKWALQKAGLCRRSSDAVFPLGYKRSVVTASELNSAGKELCRNGVDPTKFIVWFIGAFGKTYDLEPVIRAAKQLLLQGQNTIQLVFSGAGEKAQLWKKMANGLPNIVFTGWVDAAKIEFLGRSSKIGLAAYADNAPQGLPNKVFEYFSFGLPVLSSLKGETEDLLRSEQCGYSYEIDRPDVLAKTILHLMNNESDRALAGNLAKNLFNSKFSADVISPRLLQHIERVVLNTRHNR